VTSASEKQRLIVEAIVVVAVTIAIWGFLYAPFLETCCGAADGVIIAILWSASLVGGFLTASGNNPGRGAVLVGLIIEALALWSISRVVVRAMTKKEGRKAST